MSYAHKLGFEPKVLVDYRSADGPKVLGMKGVLFGTGLEHFRRAGLYDDYAATIDPKHLECLLQALASAWVPAEAAMAHFETLDRMRLSDSQITALNEPLGATLYQTIFGALLRMARNAGAEGVWAGLKQSDRIVSRFYRGGGFVLEQVGPKDAVLELTGFCFAESRSYRVGHCGFLRGMMSLTTKSCVVREVPSRAAKSERYVVSVSWV